MMYDGKTVDDALAAWDAGDIIFTVEMGGLGPGYEQAIQVLVMELLRDMRGKPLPTTNDEAWKWGDPVVNRLDALHGFSGAQVGAAKSLAIRMLRDGYAQTLDSAKSHDPARLIQVSGKFPSLATP